MLTSLGKSGLRVSRVCLGTMTFGHPEYGCDQAEAGKILDAYLSAGHNFIDSADIYAKGDSEAILGNLLGSRRKDVVLATKGFWAVEDGPNNCGASRKHLIEACDNSLRRLKTDYIDLYYVHIWDPLTPLEETLGALHTLVEQGKVRYIGASDYAGWQLNEALHVSRLRHWNSYIVHQVEYSALARDIEIEIVPATTYHGLGVVGWSPLAGGMLSGKYAGGKGDTGRVHSGDAGKWWGDRFGSEANDRGSAEFIAIAKELNVSPVSLAVAFTLRPEWMTSAIIGVRSLAQLESNLAGEQLKIPEDVYQRLLAVKPPYRPFPLPMHDNAMKLRTKTDYTT